MAHLTNVSFTSVQSQSSDTATDSSFGGIELSAIDKSSPIKPPSSSCTLNVVSLECKFEEDGYVGELGVSSVFGASFNFINSIVGAGIIAIPSAVQQCGLILGVLLLMLVAYLVNCSVLMLIDCGLKAGKYDLEELAEHLLGRRGYYFTLIFMFLFGYGAQIAYLVVLGDTVPRAAQLLAPGTFFCNRFNTLLLLSTLFILPLSSVRKLSTLAWTSMISVAGVVIVILIVLIACATLSSNQQDEHFEVSDIDGVNDSVFAGVGTMAFAFVCQHNSFMVFRSLAQPTAKEWRKVAALSLSFSWFVCTAFGLIGFFTFFPYVRGDLLNNFPVSSVAIAVARLFLAFTMVLTYPMECYVTRHCVLSILTKLYDDRREARGLTDPAPNPDSMLGKMDRALATVTDAAILYTTNTASIIVARATSVFNRENSTNNAHASVSNHSPTRRQGNSTYTSVEGNNQDHSAMHLDATEKGQTSDIISSSDSNVTNPLFASTSTSNAYDNGTTQSATFDEQSEQISRNISTNGNGASHYANNANDTSLPATDRASSAAHIGFTLLLWGSSLCIALIFKELGVVASLTGAVAASMLGFVLPATLYLKTHEVAVREAYRVAKLAYGGSDNNISSSAIIDGACANGTSTDAYAHISLARNDDAVVNPINSGNQQVSEEDGVITVTFSRIDDNHDGEINLSAAPELHNNRDIKLCGAMENTTLWRMVIPFRQFWLPFFMIFFGFVSLIVGVMTVFRDSS